METTEGYVLLAVHTAILFGLYFAGFWAAAIDTVKKPEVDDER